jgi:hypothetical protein
MERLGDIGQLGITDTTVVLFLCVYGNVLLYCGLGLSQSQTRLVKPITYIMSLMWPWLSSAFMQSAPDLSRRQHLSTFSQKLKCGWQNISRKVVHVNYLNNVNNIFSKSNFFPNKLTSSADDIVKFRQSFVCFWCNHGFHVPVSFSPRFEQMTSFVNLFIEAKVWVNHLKLRFEG